MKYTPEHIIKALEGPDGKKLCNVQRSLDNQGKLFLNEKDIDKKNEMWNDIQMLRQKKEHIIHRALRREVNE